MECAENLLCNVNICLETVSHWTRTEVLVGDGLCLVALGVAW